MTPYAISSGYIPQPLLDIFHIMRTAFEKLPDFEDEVITCHALCTAFAKRYDLTCVDGYFGTGNEHSWLIKEEHPKVIIDMYPIGGASPFIVYKHWILPWDKLYIPKVFHIDKESRDRQTEKILSVL
jgi:hypothetical protein